MKIGDLILQVIVNGQSAVANLRQLGMTSQSAAGQLVGVSTAADQASGSFQKLGNIYIPTAIAGEKKLAAETAKVSAGHTDANKSSSLFSAGLGKISLVIGGAVGLYRLLTSSIRAALEASNTSEEATARLTAGLAIHGRATQENIQYLRQIAAERMNVTKYDDDETVSAQARLAAYDLEVDTIAELTPLLQDVATMTDKSTGSGLGLEGAVKLITLAMEGQASRLRMAGINVGEYDKQLEKATTDQEKMSIVMKILKSNAEGMAVAIGETDSAAMKKLGNAIGERLEQFGDWIKMVSGPLTRALTDIIMPQQQQSDLLAKQRTQLGYTLTVLKTYADQEHLTAYELSNRNKVLKNLKEEYPGYFKSINMEKASYNEIAAAIEKINQNLLKKIRIKIYEEEIEALDRQRVAIEKDDEAARKRYASQITSPSDLKKLEGQAKEEATIVNEIEEKRFKKTKEKNATANKILLDQQIELQKKLNDISFIEPSAPPKPSKKGTVELTEKERDVQAEIKKTEAERAGSNALILFYQDEISKLDANVPEQKLQILQYENAIAAEKEKQAAVETELAQITAKRAGLESEIAYWTGVISDLKKKGQTPDNLLEIAKAEEKLRDLSKEAIRNEQKRFEVYTDLSNEFSSTIKDALVTQWQRGESAAERWGNTMIQMIEEVAAEILSKAAIWGLLALLGVSTGGVGSFVFGGGSGLLGQIGKIFGFASGGYTGDGATNAPAGTVHRGEVVFESAITRPNLPELLALRSSLQSGMSLKQVLSPSVNVSVVGMDTKAIVMELREIRAKVNQAPKVNINQALNSQKFYAEVVVPGQKSYSRRVV